MLLAFLPFAAATDLVVAPFATETLVSGDYDRIIVEPGGVLRVDGDGAVVDVTARLFMVRPGGMVDGRGGGQPLDPSHPAQGAAGAGSGQSERALDCSMGVAGDPGVVPSDAFAIQPGGASGQGSGGAALRLVAQTIELWGPLDFDGEAGAGGGAVALIANELLCHSTVSARGGTGSTPDTAPGGGGAVFLRGDTVRQDCTVDVGGGVDSGTCAILPAGDGVAVFDTVDFDGDGEPFDCDPLTPVGPELCNGLDDDCDGTVDEDGCPCEPLFTAFGTYLYCADVEANWLDAGIACDAIENHHLWIVAGEAEAAAVVDQRQGPMWTGLMRQADQSFRWSPTDAVAPWNRPWAAADAVCDTPEPQGQQDCAVVSGGDGCGAMREEDCQSLHPYVCEPCVPVPWYLDLDLDGWGDRAETVVSCFVPDVGMPWVTLGGDCDDQRSDVHPFAPDICDGVDNDCDGLVDPTGLFPADPDNDGVFDFSAPLTSPTCLSLDALAPAQPDCAPDDPAVPMPEICNGLDDDCDGVYEASSCSPCTRFSLGNNLYLLCPQERFDDAEDACAMHGYDLAVPTNLSVANRLGAHLVSQGEGRAWVGGSYDPSTGELSWTGPEGMDPPRWAVDPDSLGLVEPACVAVSGVAGIEATWALESCVRQLPVLCSAPVPPERFDDLDGDGFGAGLCTGADCVDQGGDCDDDDVTSFPGAPEVVGDGIDHNCDGQLDCPADDDGDGWTGDGVMRIDAALQCLAIPGGDCDDAEGGVHPTAEELTSDGVDQDCDGRENCLIDVDGDGYGDRTTVSWDGLFCPPEPEEGDCDDSNPDRSPGASEQPCNGVDDDCDPTTLDGPDDDSDGDSACNDCDDGDAQRYTGATEIACDGIDQDCDGVDPPCDTGGTLDTGHTGNSNDTATPPITVPSTDTPTLPTTEPADPAQAPTPPAAVVGCRCDQRAGGGGLWLLGLSLWIRRRSVSERSGGDIPM